MQVLCKGIFIISYLTWVEFLHEATGAWVYPYVGKFSSWQRIAFYVFTLVFGVMGNLFVKYINDFIWKNRVLAVNLENQKRERDVFTFRRSQ